MPRALPVPTLPLPLGEGCFPPGDCRICILFASLRGMELGKALRLMRRAFQETCACGLFLGAHGAEHPHGMAVVGCEGVRN